MDQQQQAPPPPQPRFRVNAKQTAKGFWYIDVSVELYGSQTWPPADQAGAASAKSAVELWTDHAKALKKSIKDEMGGVMADEEGAKA